MAHRTVLLVDVAVAIRGPAGQNLTGSSLLQLAAAEAFRQHRPFVLGDRPLNLEQKLIVRVVGNGAMQELDGAAGAAEFFEQQHLVGVLASQSIRAEHDDGRDHAIAHRIT
nr:hypothetical protein [Skermanella mucosa]